MSLENPMIETILRGGEHGEDTIKSLEIMLKDQSELYELKKNALSELEQSKEEQRLARIEKLISDYRLHQIKSLLKAQINDPDIGRLAAEKDNLKEFLSWDKQKSVETLNFLLSEFFSNSYPGKEWNDEFIAELIFRHTMMVNLICSLKDND